MPFCCVPFCNAGDKTTVLKRREENLPEFHYFIPPKDQDLRRQWDANIKRKGGLKESHRVCSEHFTPDLLDLTFKTTLKDGTIFEMKRDRAKLKPGAVPTIFPNYSQYNQSKQKRKPPKSRDSIPSKISRTVPVCDVQNEEPPFVDATPAEDPPSTATNVEIEPEPEQTKIWSHERANELKLPIHWVVCNTTHGEDKTLVCIDIKTLTIEKAITFKDKGWTVRMRGLEINKSCLKTDSSIQTLLEAQSLVLEVSRINVCTGTGFKTKPFSVHCAGAVAGRAHKCKACLAERERLRKIEKRKEKVDARKKEKVARQKSQKQSLRRSKAMLLLKIQRYRRQVIKLHSECEQKNEDVLNASIAALPPVQREAVEACFSASKRKGPTGNRYTIGWVYECMLMRIKDRNLYAHIQDKKILAVPSITQMNRYLKNYGGTYGFQPQTLALLRTKTIDMDMQKRRGVILIDEMKLTPGIYFDASTLNVLGMKDMGEKNSEELGEEFKTDVQAALSNLPIDPKASAKTKRKETRNKKNEKQKDKNLGDHALVISFQPFRGTWVQAIACFLTRGNATDDESTKLVLEATILLESCGLLVDGVVTDGALWNRSMWEKFGVTAHKPGVEHPCNPDRKLWFISDFPHLLKCMRNCFTDKKTITTPEGEVTLQHWQAILDAENLKKIGLRECHKLTQDHLKPNPFQKMNVAMAWQFWSSSASAAMQSYRLQGVEELEDCNASAYFCKFVNDVADAMNSNRPVNGLKCDSEQFKVIEKFRDYMKTLISLESEKKRAVLEQAEEARKKFCQQNGKPYRKKSVASLNSPGVIFSETTDYGILVNLQSVLELTKFLTSEEVGFSYVMTARFNQDALERFFGLVRQSGGANTHPEPRVFAQLFRLLSIYSLVKPLKGSNITGGEMLTTLLNLDDLKNKTREERKQELSNRLDDIILNGENLDDIPELMQHVDHQYIGESVDEFALSYVAGFTARHSMKYAGKCEECQLSLKKTESEKTDADILITLKSKGFLTYPSDGLMNLLRSLEQQVISTSLLNEMEQNLLFKVLDSLENVTVPLIGCATHEHALTKAIMKFFLITRMHFVCRRWNTDTRDQKKTQKSYRKQAHLT